MLSILRNIGLPIVDILLVSFVFYKLYDLIRGTRAVQALRGLAILIVISFLAQLADLHTVEWLLSMFWTWGVIAFIILFQAELKQWLARLGQRGIILGSTSYDDKKCIDEMVEAIEKLSNRKIGALIVWQRDANLDYYIDSGVPIDSRVSQELIMTVFQPHTLLHDGAIIIKDGRIVAASCLLPLSRNPEWEKSLGTRHRAAIGLTEETDSIVTVVSEETGSISLAINGTIIRHLDIATLDRMLNEWLVTKVEKHP